MPFPRPGSTLRSCIGCFSEHSVSMRGDLLCATCLLSAWCPRSDLLNLTSTTPFVCPHMHCFQNNPPSNPGWFYPSRKTQISQLSASFTFNKRVFSITASIRGHKRDTNPTPCLRLSLPLSLSLPTTALMLLPPSVMMSLAQWSSSILAKDRETTEPFRSLRPNIPSCLAVFLESPLAVTGGGRGGTGTRHQQAVTSSALHGEGKLLAGAVPDLEESSGGGGGVRGAGQ